MHPQPDIRNELTVIFGCLFTFCTVKAILGGPALYVQWAIIFGIILWLLIHSKR